MDNEIFDALSRDIMNLPRTPEPGSTTQFRLGYGVGHRDARHAAAELVSAATAEQSRTPVPLLGGDTSTHQSRLETIRVHGDGSLIESVRNGTVSIHDAVARAAAPAVPDGVDTAASSVASDPMFSQLVGNLFPTKAELAAIVAHIDGLLAQQREAGRREGAIIGHRDALSFSQRSRDNMAAEINELLAVRAAFYANMLKAYPDKSHDEIQAEINKVAALATRQPVSQPTPEQIEAELVAANLALSQDEFDAIVKCVGALLSASQPISDPMDLQPEPHPPHRVCDCAGCVAYFAEPVSALTDDQIKILAKKYAMDDHNLDIATELTGFARALLAASTKVEPMGMCTALDAACYIDAKAQTYLDENTDTEHDTGATVFHYGEAGREYHNSLVELAEELRLEFANPKVEPVSDGKRDAERFEVAMRANYPLFPLDRQAKSHQDAAITYASAGTQHAWAGYRLAATQPKPAKESK